MRMRSAIGVCLGLAISGAQPVAAQSLNFSRTVYSTAGFPTDAFFADLNGDGIDDVVVAGGHDDLNASAVSVRLGNADGTFGPATNYVSGDRWANNAQFVRVADLTTDGKPDIVTAGPGDTHIYVLPGNGSGQFGPAIAYDTGLMGISALDARSIPTPDLNLVTGLAIVGSSQPCTLQGCGGGYVAQLVAGTGQFHGVFWNPSTTATRGVVIAPLLSGGSTPSLQQGVATMATGLLVGLFPGGNPIAFPGGLYVPASLTAGPFAGADPFTGFRPDLIVAAGLDPASTVYESEIIVRNYLTTFATIRTGGGMLFSPSLGDIDGDGHLDLVAINSVGFGPQDPFPSRSLVIYYGAGLSFVASQTIPLSSSASSVRALSVAGGPGIIAVTDRTAGTLTIFTPGASPVHVDAGPDQVVLAGLGGAGTVHVVGGLVAAADDVISVSWSENGATLATNADATLSLGVGIHVLNFSATNANGVATDTMTTTVQPLAPALVGPTGATGLTGETGPAGATGPQGPPGSAGADGAQGPQGLQGLKGDTGSVGPQGLTGPAGADGAQGPQGLQGPKGDTGGVGPQGLTGPAGADGAQGPPGLPGPAGTSDLPQGTIIELAAGTPPPPGWTLVGRNVEKIKAGGGNQRLVVDVYRKQ